MMKLICVGFSRDTLVIFFYLDGKRIMKGIYIFEIETFKILQMKDVCLEVYKEIADALVKDGFFENRFRVLCKDENFKQKIKEYEREKFDRTKARCELALAGDYPKLPGEIPQLTLRPGIDQPQYT
mgnify:FL=1